MPYHCIVSIWFYKTFMTHVYILYNINIISGIHICKVGNHWYRGRQLLADITCIIVHYLFIFGQIPNKLTVGSFVGSFFELIRVIAYVLLSGMYFPTAQLCTMSEMMNWMQLIMRSERCVNKRGSRAGHSLLFSGAARGLNDVITCCHHTPDFSLDLSLRGLSDPQRPPALLSFTFSIRLCLI